MPNRWVENRSNILIGLRKYENCTMNIYMYIVHDITCFNNNAPVLSDYTISHFSILIWNLSMTIDHHISIVWVYPKENTQK